MPSLPALAWRYFWISSASTFIAGCAVGWVRLLPWLLAAEVPLAATGPFVVQLVIGALEAAALLAAPVAAALGAADFYERGEARALFALGVSPLACARAVARKLLLPLAAVAALARLGLGTGSDTPLGVLGRVSAGVEERCQRATRPLALAVPGTAFSWLCGPSHPPLLVGPLAGGSDLWLTGRALRVTASDELAVQGAVLAQRPSQGRSLRAEVGELKLKIAAGAATVAPGLAAFAPALLGAYLAAPLLVWLLLSRRVLGRGFCFGLGIVAGCAALGMLGWRHPAGHPRPAHCLLGALRIAAPALAVLLFAGAEQLHSNVRRAFARW